MRSLGDKVQVGPELIRPDQVVNPMKGLWRRSEMEMKSSLFNCVWIRAHGAWWLFSELDLFESRRRLLEFVIGIHREGRQKFEDQRTDMHSSCAQYQSTNTGYSPLITWIS